MIGWTSQQTMSASKRTAVVLMAIAGSLLGGCGEQAPTDASKMLLKSVGPDNIKAGVEFNVQPDGSNALWLNAEGVPKTAVPVLAGVELPSVNVRDKGTLVTAVVPKDLTKAPGSFPLFLLDKPSGQKSNEIQFVVK